LIEQIELYAVKGLRTLMFAYRNVRENELEGNVIDFISENFESELTLLGVTGVEDEL
jgi:magnesium-transporting ATPase (P-type)